MAAAADTDGTPSTTSPEQMPLLVLTPVAHSRFGIFSGQIPLKNGWKISVVSGHHLDPDLAADSVYECAIIKEAPRFQEHDVLCNGQGSNFVMDTTQIAELWRVCQKMDDNGVIPQSLADDFIRKYREDGRERVAKST